MIMSSYDIADVLRRLMAADPNVRGNQTRLAKLTGLKQPTIHRILSGQSEDPKDSTLRKIAVYFGVTVDQLRGAEPLPGLNDHAVLDQPAAYGTLTADERRLLAIYRRLAQDDREVIEAQISALESARTKRASR